MEDGTAEGLALFMSARQLKLALSGDPFVGDNDSRRDPSSRSRSWTPLSQACRAAPTNRYVSYAPDTFERESRSSRLARSPLASRAHHEHRLCEPHGWPVAIDVVAPHRHRHVLGVTHRTNDDVAAAVGVAPRSEQRRCGARCRTPNGRPSVCVRRTFCPVRSATRSTRPRC